MKKDAGTVCFSVSHGSETTARLDRRAATMRQERPRALRGWQTRDQWNRRYTRAFGDGPRNFEPWSSDVDDTRAGTPSLTTTHQREDVSALDRFNVHRCPTRRVFSGTGIEPVTKQAMVRYLYHSATAATQNCLKSLHYLT
ncbi:uncharacterized protein TNCV_1424491 [Trichonephila clavipes]|nr:uncharacterized protein TNCV_1424491 [Trichonephila clavipes]